MPGTYGDAALVKHHADVAGMRALDREAHNPGLIGGHAMHIQAFDFYQSFRTVVEQRFFMRLDILHADVTDVIYRLTQANHLDDSGRTGLEFIRRFLVCRVSELNTLDHVATALVWRHGFENIVLAVEHSYSGRPRRVYGR